MDALEMFWLWGIIGLILIGIEMLTGTLYVLWFAVASLLLSLLVWLYPGLPMTWQLFIYAILALGSLFLYRYFYEKHDPNLTIGQAQGDEIGTIGTIIETVMPRQAGKIKFTQGVMGSREWVAVSDDKIAVNALAEIIAIEGNTLRVKAK